MTNGSTRAGRGPRDTRTRERLREAQQREAEAVASVCSAEHALQKTCAKRDAVLTATTATVDDARATVEAAQSVLVTVSGLERAALLLGVDSTELRKAVVARNGRRAEA